MAVKAHIKTRPKTATIGVVLSIIGGGLYILLVSLVLVVVELSKAELHGVTYSFWWGALIIIGGILMFRRKYKLGGAVSLVFGIVTMFTEGPEFWYLFVLPIIGGILGLISREKVEEGVLAIARLYGRLKSNDLAAKLAITEADVELAVIKLQSRGKPIRFEASTREVVYEGRAKRS
ncbi:hypothetical protein KAU93_03335 [Candidatus Bathyarchaeota archaeon]|nr:hypothetical protein [Candidatus Bathyarchaeota archaeon]